MLEVHPRLWVGDCEDFESIKDTTNWYIVHACKEPYHRNLLGYTSNGCPTDNPEYLYAVRGNRLYLNLVDSPKKEFIPHEIIKKSLDFICEGFVRRKSILVHCNRGESRSASIVFMYLAHRLAKFDPLLEIAMLEFSNVYPKFSPSKGISGFMQDCWEDGI